LAGRASALYLSGKERISFCEPQVKGDNCQVRIPYLLDTEFQRFGREFLKAVRGAIFSMVQAIGNTSA